jgi:hypothetical protein
MQSLANLQQVSSSSSSRTSSISPNASGFPASCPTDDHKTIRDNNGVAYQVLCASDVAAQNGGDQSGATASSSFNDFFGLCDAAVMAGGAGRCTGFTYVGQVNGAGAGNCYLKSGTSYTIGAAGTNNVGAIRQADVGTSSAVPSSSSSVVLASTTSSSSLLTLASTTSSSSLLTLASSTSNGTSSSVSSSVSSSSSAVATGSYSCPANDQQITTNGGTQYQLRCGISAVPVSGTGVYFRDPTIRASFNECLQGCTTNAFESPQGSGIYPTCTGYTFTVTDPAAGTGTCNYRQQNPLTFDVTNQYFTGLIKAQYYQAPSSSASSSVTPSPNQTQTVTFTTVSYATVTTISSYPVTNTVVSTLVQTYTTSYPVTTTQVSTAPGQSHSNTACFA